MSFNEKLYIAACFVGYHACLLGTFDSWLWAFPAGFFVVAALLFIDAKVKK